MSLLPTLPTAYYASQRVGVSPQLLARLTGSVFLAPPKSAANMDANEGRGRINIGLNLKNNKRNEEVKYREIKMRVERMEGENVVSKERERERGDVLMINIRMNV